MSAAADAVALLAARKRRFEALVATLAPRELRWLGAVASEQALERSALSRFAGPLEVGSSLGEWLSAAVTRGLLVELGPPGRLGMSSVPAREPLFGVPAAEEQLILRELEARNELAAVAEKTEGLLGARSVSRLALALTRGDLPTFERHHGVPRLPRPVPTRTRAEWLRASVCEPFDPGWFERTWGAAAPRLGAHIQHESLDGPSDTGGLPLWLAARVGAVLDGETQAAMASALCQSALLRGDAALPEVLLDVLTPALARGFRAAACFVRGERGGAEALLDAALREGKKGLGVPFGAAAPLLALLLVARDSEASAAFAKRVMATGKTAGERAAASAFRTLLRQLGESELHRRRLAVHQLAPNAGAWEVLLTGLTVHLCSEQPTARASWAQHLTRKALSWGNQGFDWLRRQALSLADSLSRGVGDGEPERGTMNGAPATEAARGPSLAELVTPKPEWKRALLALAEVSESFSETADHGRRVLWFVDMTDGSLNRPALQEYRVTAGGWSQGQRRSFAELHACLQELPPEDQRVLASTRELPGGRREPTPEAFEALIGHPRVVSSTRVHLPVDVVRGTCRVRTEEDGGHIRVLVEPAGAAVGVHVVPESDSRLVVYRVTKAMHRVIEALPRGARIPREHEPEMLRVLGQLAQNIEVLSPELGSERSVDADSTPCLRFSPHAGAWLVQAGVRPFGSKGRFFVAGVGRRALSYAAEGARLCTVRDLPRERERVLRLVAACPSLQRDADEQEDAARADEEHSWVLGEEGVLALLAELRDGPERCEVEWPERPALRLAGTVHGSRIRGRLRAIKGWYLASGKVALDDVTEVTLNELVRAPSLAGGRFLRLPSGDYVEVESRIRRVMAALRATTTGKRDGAELRVHPGAVATLAQLTEPDSGFDVDDAATAWLERTRRVATEDFPVPASLRAELRPYQVHGYRWLCRLAELGLGACLADDMGLGKTLQILAFLLTRGARGPAIVVAPTSVCGNWSLEMRRFAPSLTPVEYFGDDRAKVLADLVENGQGKVLVTSYAILQQDEAEFAAVPFDTAVLDEAQFIKNADTRRARAALRLSATQRIAATGTPVENHYGDLWSIFEFLNPGLLGDWKEFSRRFVRPIERDGAVAPEVLLRQLVRPYVLRRLKAEVLPELPPVTEVHYDVHLSADESMRYALLRRQIHDKLFSPSGKRKNKLEILSELTRLRRFCCHPRLVFPEADRESSKVDTFLELASELVENEHRALVFSQYVDFLSLVREHLDERGIRYEYLDGATPQSERQARVEAFQRGDAPLFLISLKAGGFGLNLTAADYVIHLDPWWNPAVEAQATDRAHRFGQVRPVTVYRLVTRSTIEENIVALHAKKQRLARSLLEGGAEAADLTAEELVRLIEGEPKSG